MARVSKRPEGNLGSLKKGDGYRVAYFTWDDEKGAWFVKDKTAKKSYGPFTSLAQANETGSVEFYYDGGRRAGHTATPTPEHVAAVEAVAA